MKKAVATSRGAAPGLSLRAFHTVLAMASAFLLLGLVTLTQSARAEGDPAASPIDITSFTAPMFGPGAVEENRAGHRPVQADNVINVGLNMDNFEIGLLRTAIVDMPVGFTGNLSEIPKCSTATLTQSTALTTCPRDTRIGTFHLTTLSGGGAFPLYNMEVPHGHAARFATQVAGMGIVNFMASVRPEDNGITVSAIDNIFTPLTLIMVSHLELWGVPAHPRHDADRGGPAEVPPVPFLTLPTSCGTPMETHLTANSWQAPNDIVERTYVGPAMTGCENLKFNPDIKIQPQSTRAGVPSAYVVEVSQDLSESANTPASAHLKDVEVTFPEGVRINPAVADRLATCSEEQLGQGTGSEVRCPADSTIGQVRIDSPLLDQPLTGAVYQAEQDNNPFGSMLAIYMNPKNDRYGVQFKLAGEVKLDPATGRLTSTFKDNPQLPFSKLTLNLKGGNRAVLINPSTCGEKTTDWSIASWAQPDSPVVGSDTFAITTGPEGRPCPSTDAERPFAPGFEAGVVDPVAGANTSFSLRVSRADDDQELRSIRKIQLPEGLLGAVGTVPLCDEAQAAAGSCPESSRVGHVQIATGAGQTPLWVPGAGKAATGVYLTGPYNGAPYGLAIKVPAQAGPFDLGTVIVRSALHVDELTTAITTGIDESRLIDRDGTVTEVLPGDLPRILKGIVLNQREIRVILDRDGFMVNPTNCSPKQITAEVHGFGGGQVDVADRFRAVDCAALAFAPRFRAQILNKGRKSTLRSFHPRTRFTVVPRKGDANIRAARVVLPSSTLLDQANIGTTCTRPQMAANDCPEASIVGHARAWSPLLQRPVQGPVYLAANGGVRPLPDLAAVMDGEIRVRLMGEISTLRRGRTARLQNTFRVVPDAPVSRFVLTMRGGAKRGLLVNSTDLCRTNERGVAVFRGQNGRTHRLRPRIATAFRGCAKVRRQVARRSNARKAMARKAAARKQSARATSRKGTIG